MANINTRRMRVRSRVQKSLHSFIAAAVDYRGEHDELVYLFRGCTHAACVKVFDWLIGGGRGIARAAIVTEEHDVVRRNGFGYWRVAVSLREPNYNFATLESQKILIEVAFKHHLSPCLFQWLTLDKFLNV